MFDGTLSLTQLQLPHLQSGNWECTVARAIVWRKLPYIL